MLFRRVQEDLIVFVARQSAAPDEQKDEDSGDGTPGNQQIKDRGCKRVIHGNLPIEPARSAGRTVAGMGVVACFYPGSIAPQMEMSRVNYRENRFTPKAPRTPMAMPTPTISSRLSRAKPHRVD